MSSVKIQRSREFKKNRRSQGLCDCGNPLGGRDKNKCPKCRDKHVARLAEIKRQRKANGLCNCEKVLYNDIYCVKCNNRKNLIIEKRNKNVEKGLCKDCGVVNNNKKLSCQKCNEKKKKCWSKT